MPTRGDPTTIHVHAAGSLRNVLPAMTEAFSTATGIQIDMRHGPAGLLRQRIEAGERPDLFMSANFAHPARLADGGLSGPPIVFARNRMVAIARRDAQLTSGNFVDRLLDPVVRIGTSTPLTDPSGDYAWAIFRRAEEVKPGAFAILDAKAKKLVGGAIPAATAGSYDVVSEALSNGAVDLFLGYVTGLRSLAAGLDSVALVEIPAAVNVVPEYGMVALHGCAPAALSFALFVMSRPGQALLDRFGFHPVALPALS